MTSFKSLFADLQNFTVVQISVNRRQLKYGVPALVEAVPALQKHEALLEDIKGRAEEFMTILGR